MQTSEQKISNRIVGVCLTILFSITVFSQTTVENRSNKNDPEAVSSVQDTEDLIHTGDFIDVDVVGSSEFDWRGSLTPEGFLDGINFVDEPVYALCRTEQEVAAEVVKGYEKTLRNPQVIVKIIDRSRRPVSLLYGAVKTPQRFQIRRAVKLNELLILAGGITEKASGEIQILRSPNLSCSAKKEPTAHAESAKNKTDNAAIDAREADSQNINIKISDLLKGQPESNPLILTGDVVTVLESKPIYITGGVVNPRQVNALAQMNISRAIAAAGGLAKNGDPKRVTIFRRENNETKIIELDLDKIKTGQAEDLTLKAFDIVEVAQKGKSKGKYVAVSADAEGNKTNAQNLPLRIID